MELTAHLGRHEILSQCFLCTKLDVPPGFCELFQEDVCIRVNNWPLTS